ncbi:kelch-like protein 11 [Saccoglossus kowalevskii]|uniref:Kelch-like protein 3-like n=1 Tax=Saccoglossus kowalevskii TaxID=10224 RepID=A0ABM0M5B2_SACKO|nr:PREDICTED: kelch-like protein 3-like [Saccoglossus kowalevskii]
MASKIRIFSKMSHPSSVLTQFRRYQCNGAFCDMKLVVGDHRFNAHRIVLAACSPYFEALFRSSLQESQAGSVELICTTGVGMEAILKYVYTGEVELTVDNTHDILRGADHLMIDDLKEFCEIFLQTMLSPSNCTSYLETAELYNLSRLQDDAQRLIESRFSEFLKQNEQELLELSFEKILSFLSNERIVVSREEGVFEFVVKWVTHDEKRIEQFPKLLMCVRLIHIEKDYLFNCVLNEKLVTQNDTCREYVSEAVRFYMSDNHTIENHRPGRLVDVVVLAGGNISRSAQSRRTISIDHTATDTVFGYVVCEDRWVQLPSLPGKISWRPVVCRDNKIIIIGSSQERCLKNVYMYDPLLNKWTVMPETNHDHKLGYAVICNGKLYAIGGYPSPRSLEMFNDDENRWVEKSPMLSDHYIFKATVINNRYIYAFGIETAGQIEYYDTLTDHWTIEPHGDWNQLNADPTWQLYPPIVRETPDTIEITRLGSRCIAINKCEREITSIDCPRFPIPDMSRRHHANICDIQGDIFICCGRKYAANTDVPRPDDSGYIFNTSSGEWKSIAPTVQRISHASCVAVKIPYYFVKEM